jgi:hypothetical protein
VDNTALEIPEELNKKAYQHLLALIERAQKGDESVLPALRHALESPAIVDLVGGDLARQAQLTIINKFAGSNLLYRESVTRKLELLRIELGGGNPPPLERLLVERIVTCWLHLHHLELIHASHNQLALDLAAYFRRSISAAHCRYLAAIKTLALVRKLAVPVLQVNIARKQVNIAGPSMSQGDKSNGP